MLADLTDRLVQQGSVAIGRGARGELDELPPPHGMVVRGSCRLGQHRLQSVIEPHWPHSRLVIGNLLRPLYPRGGRTEVTIH
jgi:hypothetical protein